MVSAELAAFQSELKSGDRAKALELAQAYIDPRRQHLAPFFSMYTLEGLVKLMDAYREKGDEASCIILEMWVQLEHGPQKVTGAFDIRFNRESVVAAAEAILRQGRKE